MFLHAGAHSLQLLPLFHTVRKLHFLASAKLSDSRVSLGFIANACGEAAPLPKTICSCFESGWGGGGGASTAIFRILEPKFKTDEGGREGGLGRGIGRLGRGGGGGGARRSKDPS